MGIAAETDSAPNRLSKLGGDDVAWTVPEYARREVDAAGAYLSRWWSRNFESDGEYDTDRVAEAFAIMNNWRSSHSFPLNTFQTTLRGKARAVFADSVVAQRIKRVPSIMLKLDRFPSMKLSQMQDIGGCRAVVGSAAQVVRLRNTYVQRSNLRHVLVREKNYIEHPKPSGYRGIHLVYRYFSDRSRDYEGHQIEMQLRSRIQHVWATAVETAGTFLERSLKSSEGPEEWLNLFALASSAFAIKEQRPPVPGTPAGRGEIRKLLKQKARALQVETKLRTFGAALNIVAADESLKNAHYYLLELVPEENKLTVVSYTFNQLKEATSEYLDVEKRMAEEKRPGSQAVLVSANSLDALRKAYPNFYLDTDMFLTYLREEMQ